MCEQNESSGMTLANSLTVSTKWILGVLELIDRLLSTYVHGFGVQNGVISLFFLVN